MKRINEVYFNDKDIKALYKVVNFVIDNEGFDFAMKIEKEGVKWEHRSELLSYEFLCHECSYETLQHPYARAVYLLSELEGVRND